MTDISGRRGFLRALICIVLLIEAGNASDSDEVKPIARLDEIEVDENHSTRCRRCKGTGKHESAKFWDDTCSSCNGEGWKVYWKKSGGYHDDDDGSEKRRAKLSPDLRFGNELFTIDDFVIDKVETVHCPKCKGSGIDRGWFVGFWCKACKGQGWHVYWDWKDSDEGESSDQRKDSDGDGLIQLSNYKPPPTPPILRPGVITHEDPPADTTWWGYWEKAKEWVMEGDYWEKAKQCAMNAKTWAIDNPIAAVVGSILALKVLVLGKAASSSLTARVKKVFEKPEKGILESLPLPFDSPFTKLAVAAGVATTVGVGLYKVAKRSPGDAAGQSPSTPGREAPRRPRAAVTKRNNAQNKGISSFTIALIVVAVVVVLVGLCVCIYLLQEPDNYSLNY